MMLKAKNTITEISAGGIVYKRDSDNYLFLLGKSSGYHKWVLPKGRIEKGETEKQTALREIEEETSVKGKIVGDKPIYEEKYIYYADFKTREDVQNKLEEQTRRVKIYQENGGGKTKVLKTVKYFLVEYLSGEPINHGWEMEDCDWFSYEEALKTVAFAGQKKVIETAYQILKEE